MIVAGFIGVALLVVRDGGFAEEVGVAVAAWGLLFLALAGRTNLERVTTAIVVVVATAGEIMGAMILGVYGYEVGHVPAFVPPGHGLVFLAACALAELEVVQRYGRNLVAGVCAVAIGWGWVAATRASDPDVFGFVGVAAFVLTVIYAPQRWRPQLTALFVVVTLLELYGTAVGTWQWAPAAPLLGLPAGDPPVGAASGYALFALAGFLLARPLTRVARIASSVRDSAAS